MHKDDAALHKIAAVKIFIIMIHYAEKSQKIPLLNLKYVLTYFDAPYTASDADIVREWQYSKPRGISFEFYTLFTDLTETEDVLFSRIEKNTKYEINRAKNKDAVTVKTENASEVKNDFCRFYNEFAKSKSLPLLYKPEIDLLVQNDMLFIRSAGIEDKPLVFHTYISAQGRVRLLHSASLFRESSSNAERNLTGRANRLLHWEDICYFKENGFLIYDWGGISMEKSDTQKQAINQFKEAFGGAMVKEYKSFVPASIKGFCYLYIKKLLGKISL